MGPHGEQLVPGRSRGRHSPLPLPQKGRCGHSGTAASHTQAWAAPGPVAPPLGQSGRTRSCSAVVSLRGRPPRSISKEVWPRSTRRSVTIYKVPSMSISSEPTPSLNPRAQNKGSKAGRRKASS